MSQLEAALADGEELLDVFTCALLDTGEITVHQLDQRRRALHGQGYRNGARLVARAWVDPEFRLRLLETGREAARELDIPPGRLGKLGVAENTEREHNVVVCTLCSCYPHDLLGDPPWWYRTDEYKRRIIEDPRAMLADMFGLEVPPERAVTVRDSTSDVRWMVLPRRPEGSEALTEDELADLVTPESLVGTAEPRIPQDPA
jgi:nitrile hydratase subunit alpha